MTSLFIESFWHIYQLNTLSSVEPTHLIRSLAYLGDSHRVGISEALEYDPNFIRHRNADTAKELLPPIVHLNLGGGLAKLVYESVCMGEYVPKSRIRRWYRTEAVWATRHLLEVWERRPDEVLSEEILTEQLSNFRWHRPQLDQPMATQRILVSTDPEVLPPRYTFWKTPSFLNLLVNTGFRSGPKIDVPRSRLRHSIFDPCCQPDPKIDVPSTGLDGVNWFITQTYEIFL